MFGKKDTSSHEQSSSRGRQRVTFQGIPTVKDIRTFLAAASDNKGAFCEFLITAPKGVFVLGCQFPTGSPDPQWTLYSGEDAAKQLWSYCYNDVEMITEILAMSLTDSEKKPNLSSAIFSSAATEKSAASPPESRRPKPASFEPLPAEPLGSTSGGSSAGQPATPTNAWSGNAAWTGQQQMQPDVSRAQPKPGVDPQQFLSYLSQNKQLTIGELVFNSQLPPNCADAAMRLQELVCKNAIDEKIAREAIKIVVQQNGVFDDNTIAAARARANDDPDVAARKAAEILQQAGFIKDQDVVQAESTAEKIGGNVGDVLVSAGKIDKLLLDSALQCVPYIGSGRMRSDQAIIALHYCQRMRAPLNDALEELSIDIS